jgi:DNA-directed RNA polymerase subunit RPC12/RpoP
MYHKITLKCSKCGSTNIEFASNITEGYTAKRCTICGHEVKEPIKGENDPFSNYTSWAYTTPTSEEF